MYFFLHFGWLRKKNAQQKHIRIIPFFLLPSVTPPFFFLSARHDQELSPNFALHLGRMKHFQGDASLRSSGWECLEGGVKIFWVTWWEVAPGCHNVHGGWTIRLIFLKIYRIVFLVDEMFIDLSKKSSQIYRITGHIYQWDISRNLDIFFRKQPELQPGSLCERLVRFGDVLTKKNVFFLGPCEFKFVVFFSKKDPQRELQLFLLLGWETDVLKANYFWGVHQFHLAYLGCLFGEVLRFFDLETNSHLH